MSQFEGKYNATKNQVFIKIKGIINKRNVDEYYNTVMTNLNKAKPGLTVILEVTEGKANTPDVEPKMAELRKELIAKQPKGIATVVTSAMMKAYTTRQLKELKENNTFGSVEEAEKFLDSL